MSDLAEIRNALSRIAESTAKTATDIEWIKRGMVDGRKRMDASDKRIGKLERWQHAVMAVYATCASIGTFVADRFFLKS